MTIVGYLLNLACWKRMQERLLNQNQIWVKESWGWTAWPRKQCKQESIADVLIKFYTEKRPSHGICWHARVPCQGKHGVSSSFESFHDAIDGHEGSRLAILELKCMQKHSISLLTSQSLTSVRTCTGVGTWSSFHCAEIRNALIYHDWVKRTSSELFEAGVASVLHVSE